MQDGKRTRIVVTRPQLDGERLAAEFAQRGLEPLLLPLIDIAPAPQASLPALHAAWDCLARFRAAMFVSSNAVDHFFSVRPPGAAWPGVFAWAPGPGTVRALLGQGVPAAWIAGPAQDASQFDSESLWLQVRDQVRAGDEVLVVRGGDASGQPRGRDWLAGQVVEAGGRQREVVAYVRRPPPWDAAQRESATRAASDGSVWLFSSSEAVSNLQALLPAQSWQRARAVATHPRIAQAARGAGFGIVGESRPGLDETVASIESLNDH